MRIAVASDDGTTIASHFGKTRGFVVYEVDGGDVASREYLKNTFTGHAQGLASSGHVEGHGTGHFAARHGPILVALEGCTAVIAHGMGKRIYDDLRDAGIEAFIVNETQADDALALYLKNALEDHPEKGCEH